MTAGVRAWGVPEDALQAAGALRHTAAAVPAIKNDFSIMDLLHANMACYPPHLFRDGESMKIG